MEFDYKGFSEEKIKEYCESAVIQVPFKNKFLGTEFYSYGLIVRKFAFFPSFLPYRVCHDHGLASDISINDDEKEDCDTRIVFQKNREKICKPFFKHVKTIMFPYFFYRKLRKIEQVKNPKGTLIFAGHFYDIKAKKMLPSVEEIKNLPEKYQPACVCMHISDIRNGSYKQYMEAGIPVYTAGSESDIRFVKRFYEILKNFKYTMSHTIGTSVFYSIEMGIPFILTKEKFVDPPMNNIAELFTDNLDEEIVITKEQMDFMKNKLCMGRASGSISRIECSVILWWSFLKYIFTKEAWKRAKTLFRDLSCKRFYKILLECMKV